MAHNGAMPQLDMRIQWSVAIYDVTHCVPLFNHHPNRCLKTASIGKLFLLAEIMRQVEAHTVSLDQQISRDDEQTDDPMSDSGILYMLNQRSLSIADLCVLVGAFSDNYATNLLIERVSLASITQMTRDVLGFNTSRLLDKVRDKRLSPPMPVDMSQGCAAELCSYVCQLAQGTLISRSASSQIERWLSADADTSMVASAFRVDPLAHWPSDAGVHLSHKTGTEHDVRCDVGMITNVADGHQVAYAVLANWDTQRYGDLRDVALHDMASIGADIRSTLHTQQVQAW